MTKLILILIAAFASVAHANEMESCFNLCKLVKEEGKNLKCEVAMLDPDGTVLYLDVLKKPLPTREKIYFNDILSCYFKTGGTRGEIHWADSEKFFASCAPARTRAGYICDKTEAKYSLRNKAKKK